MLGLIQELTYHIHRLEAATSRLEDMASAVVEQPPKINGQAPTASAAVSIAPPTPVESVPESVEDFDTFMSTTVAKYVTLSNAIGGPIAAQAAAVMQGFKGQRSFLLISTKAKKPEMTSPVYGELLKPIQQGISAVVDIRDANRGSPVFDQLSAVSESVSVFAWVTIDPKPVKHIEESLGSSQYYGNRVLKENKDK